MRILISNDDGIFAKGIITLAEALLSLGKVWVAAPNRERSGASHSLTIECPLRAVPVSFPIAVESAYAVSGTPSDCVKLAICKLLPDLPDVVVTGINRGANMCVDVFYSGTIAAAFEGAFRGIPAIAFSLADYGIDADFSGTAHWVKTCVEEVMKRGPMKGVIYNINFPALPPEKVKGIRITRLGNVQYRDSYEKRVDPGGKPYYWLTGELEILDKGSDCDILAVRDGYISLTPIRAELTDFQAFKHMNDNGFADTLFQPIREK